MDPIAVESRLAFRKHLLRLVVGCVAALAAFSLPLLWLASFAVQSDLYSYVPLVPLIAAYLIWTERQNLVLETGGLRLLSGPFFLASAALVAGYWRWGAHPGSQDALSWLIGALVCLIWGLPLAFLGWKFVRQIFFPLLFLVFIVPLPMAALNGINRFFDYASAMATVGFCHLVGTPVFRQGVVLNLPGESLEVAPECSGIHSTLVLVMTGALAAYLFLKRSSFRAILVSAILPLAILRNGFRVFVIGELCVHYGHQMINSPIHRRGGPLFFALALVPFFLLLFFLRRIETRARPVV